MTQAIASCISGTTDLLYDMPFEQMRSSHQKLFALAIISAVGFVLLSVLTPYMSTGPYPLAAQILSYSSCGLAATAIIIHLYLRVKTDSLSGERWAYAQQHLSRNEDLEEAYFISERHGVEVVIEKKKVIEHPLEVLELFISQILEHVATPRLKITFIGQVAYDAGGLSEDFLDDLLHGLTMQRSDNSLKFKYVDETGLAVPIVVEGREESLTTYHQMGQVIMWCFPQYLIGVHLDPSVFHIVFAFTPEEVDRAFKDISVIRKQELYRILLEAQNDYKTYDRLLQLLETSDWDEEGLKDAAEQVSFIELTPEESESELREQLSQCAQGIFDGELRGIHALAQGMMSICHYKENFGWDCNPLAFSLQVQGCFDKQTVANCFVFEDVEVRGHTGWIQEWICAPDTEEQEVKQMLKYITGRTGVRESDEIKVRVQEQKEGRNPYIPEPVAKTCSNVIELPPDGFFNFSKEQFIECFKASVLGADPDFSQQ